MLINGSHLTKKSSILHWQKGRLNSNAGTCAVASAASAKNLQCCLNSVSQLPKRKGCCLGLSSMIEQFLIWQSCCGRSKLGPGCGLWPSEGGALDGLVLWPAGASCAGATITLKPKPEKYQPASQGYHFLSTFFEIYFQIDNDQISAFDTNSKRLLAKAR